MRTFTFSDASSHKFWNIDLKGNSFTVTYGRIGSTGQTQLKTFRDDAAAQKEHDKLVAEKLKKGYTETTPSAKAAPTTLLESLEQALVENPDDLASHSAYADYLIEQGEPRGEFIRVQLALEDSARTPQERQSLKKQEEQLLKAHAKEWVGDLAPFLLGKKKQDSTGLRVKHTFARGWLHSLEVENYTVAFSRVMAKSPQLRLLQRLVLNENAYEEEGTYERDDGIPEDTYWPQLYPLIRCPYLSNVKTFIVGEVLSPKDDLDGEDGGFNCQTNAEGVVGLIKRMSKLEELYLYAHEVDPDQLFSLKTLDHLRVLLLYHEIRYPLARLAKNSSLKNLTHLLCHPHAAEEDESYIPLSAVKAVVHSTALPALTHLRLRLSNMGDKGAKEIVASGILKRLKVLDLRHGCMTDAGMRTLAACPDFKSLEFFDISNNALTQAGIDALKATGVKHLATSMWEPTGEWEDYEYLSAGDIE